MMKNFIYKAVLSLLFGSLLLIGAFENLAILLNLKPFLAFHQGSEELAIYAETINETVGDVIINTLMSLALIPYMGLFVSMVIVYLIFRKNVIHWTIFLFIFIAGYILIRFEITKLFINISYVFSFNINLIASILLLIFLSILFFRFSWLYSKKIQLKERI